MTARVADNKLDKVSRWLSSILATLGIVVFSFALITEFHRIVEDFWEDGIVVESTHV
jgi:hypothetical protein